jgi:hypothetical protein
MLLTMTRLILRNELFGTGIVGEEEDMIRNFNDSAQVVFIEEPPAVRPISPDRAWMISISRTTCSMRKAKHKRPNSP